MSESVNGKKLHQSFLKSERKHILMITNHGIHQWQVIPGLPDTGGQNVYVNQFTGTLAELGFKITIVNRGGYPHPVTEEKREGLHYRNEHQRILYIEDNKKEFVRKEDMNEQTPQLAEFLEKHLENEGTAVDLIISHYWDAAKVGVLLNQRLSERVKHVWVPHSLGAVKKRNVEPERWQGLRIDERIEVEKTLIPELDAVAATSSLIRESLQENYGAQKILFLPPCVKTERYYPREIEADHEIWQFLSDHSGLSVEEVRQCKIVTEISRTDTTKRKNVLIEAFAQVNDDVPNSLLLVSIDDTEEELAAELKGLIAEHDIESHTAVVGYVWDRLPILYAVTDVYCSPSVMEGFGMSVQEAAATKVPVVGSHLIPFVKDYLLGAAMREITCECVYAAPLRQVTGAVLVQADDVAGFAYALERLLTHDSLRQELGQNAYDITIPYFTWKDMTQRFLETINVDFQET
jgi:glycosyltransferase involved in cell wall biosynthesis